MKQEQSSIGRRFGTATIVLAIITACANGGDADVDGGIDGGGKKDGTGNVVDTGAKQDVQKVCGGDMGCSSDQDCTDTCPPLNDGNIYCCDIPTKSCYTAPMCGGQDAGQD